MLFAWEALDHNPPTSSSSVAEITGVYNQAQLFSYFIKRRCLFSSPFWRLEVQTACAGSGKGPPWLHRIITGARVYFCVNRTSLDASFQVHILTGNQP